MADEDTKKCLIDWGFDDLVELFSDQEITFDTLKSLSADLIKELIPIIGKRMKFLEKWKNKFESSNTNQSIIDPGAGPSRGVLRENNNSSNTSQDKRLLSAESDYRKRIGTEENYLVNLLTNKNNLGSGIIAEYKRNQQLSDKTSILLCDYIASDLVTSCYSKFTVQDYVDITNQIVKLFPNEKFQTYFRPGVLKRLSKNNKSVKPRGRLYDKIKNKKNLFATLLGTVRRKNQPLPIEGDENDEPIAEDILESLHWLQHNRDFAHIHSHWKKTVKVRHDTLLKEEGNVYNYLKKYPFLRDEAQGYSLLNIDFDELYTTAAAKFYENWDPFITKLIKVTIRNKKKPTDNEKELLNIIDDEEADPYAKQFAQILLLPYAVPPRAGVSVFNDNYWKPSVLESKRGFVVHVKDAGDIEKIHNEKINEMSKKNTTVQPYILGIGNTLRNVNNFLVVLDKPLYRFDSPLTALATCFKIFYVWHVSFPPQSKQIWHFLQRGIFKFETDFDEDFAHVSKIIDSVNSSS